MRVEDIMTTEVATATPATPLKEVARTLVERHISGVPVVDDSGAVLGVVSEGDVLFKERGPSERRGLLARLLSDDDGGGRLKLEARTAGEAMTAPAVTTAPWRPVSSAAADMLEHRVNRLPVVSHDTLVGIITRADLVRAFVRADAEIALEIRELMERSLFISPVDVSVAVEGGDVRLAGEVERRIDAEVAAAVIEKVPGVMSLDSHLTWRGDA
jgi:CBS domain-containing protein